MFQPFRHGYYFFRMALRSTLMPPRKTCATDCQNVISSHLITTISNNVDKAPFNQDMSPNVDKCRLQYTLNAAPHPILPALSLDFHWLLLRQRGKALTVFDTLALYDVVTEERGRRDLVSTPGEADAERALRRSQRRSQRHFD